MVKNLADNAGDPGSIPFLSPGDPSWKDPLEKEMATHSSILARGNLMDRGSWQATVLGVTKSRTRLSD